MAADTDLAARIAEAAAFIEARLAEDEKTAMGLELATRFVDGKPDFYGVGGPAAHAYWEHFTTGRALRRVKAARDLVADIMADEHHDNQNSYYLCSQAEGCSDWDRKGKPCDCGRDERVLRRLEIIANEWRDSA